MRTLHTPRSAGRRRGPAALVALVVLLSPAWAADPPARTHDITVDDYLSIHLITTCETSPDGRWVAFTELRWGDHDKPRSTDLWVVNTGTGRPMRLTFDPVSEHSPQWAPDSQHLYFVTKRKRGDDRPPYDGTDQVWVLATHPGEPFPVTRVKGGVQGYQLSKDGRLLYYLKKGKEAEREWKPMREKYPDIAFGSGAFHYNEIWQLDLETWREKKLVAPDRYITEFKVAPDGRRLAMITSPDDRLITKEGQTRVDVFDLQTEKTLTLPDKLWRADAPTPYGWLEGLAWSDDGDRLAFTVGFDGYQTEILVAEWTGAQPDVRRLTRPDEISVSGSLQWIPGTADLCFRAQRRAREHIYCIADVRGGKQGAQRVLTPGDIVVHGFSFAPDGRHVAYIVSGTQHMTDVFWADLKTPAAAPARLTRINPQIDTWKLPQITLVTWKAPDGAEVEGVLELPPGYQEGDGPLPLAVELHGGPTDAALIGMQYWIYGRTLFPARGWALLSPNYRGSTGYGDKFMTDLIGREADIEVQDVLAGVDAMIERGIADPDRLGVMGWSNGGFVTNAVITTTQRFKAASSGAGVLDMFMQWGLEDTPGHVINYMRGLPWERTEAYVKASPGYRLGKVTTPTIIHVGENDERVPAANARTLYRALKEYTKTPTILLVYPGAGHGLAISDHRKGKLDWDVAWFDRYVLGKSDEPAGEEK
jgi:dipeptidyl aminopeptidase/acylaminoacyl peptidase